MTGIFALLSVVGLVACAAPALTLGQVAYGGSGCPQGSALVRLVDQTLHVDFRRFSAGMGGDVPWGQARRFCQVAVQLAAQDGWQFSVSQAMHSGHLNLTKEATCDLAVSSYFDAGGPVPVHTMFGGPLDDAFHATSLVDNAQWSECHSTDARVSVKTTVQVVGLASAQVVTGRYAVQQRPCY